MPIVSYGGRPGTERNGTPQKLLVFEHEFIFTSRISWYGMAPDRGDEESTDESSRHPPGSPAPPTILELDHIYEALGHPRRRYLC